MNTHKPTLESRSRDAIAGMSAGLLSISANMELSPPIWDDGTIPMFDQDVDDDYSLREELDCFRRENDCGLD